MRVARSYKCSARTPRAWRSAELLFCELVIDWWQTHAAQCLRWLLKRCRGYDEPLALLQALSATLHERDANGAVELSIRQHPARHHNKSPLMNFINNNILDIRGRHIFRRSYKLHLVT